LIDINNSLAEKNEKWLTIVPDMEDLEKSLADLGLEDQMNKSVADDVAEFQTPPNHEYDKMTTEMKQIK